MYEEFKGFLYCTGVKKGDIKSLRWDNIFDCIVFKVDVIFFR